MIHLRFIDDPAYLVGVGVLLEAGLTPHTRGGNEVDIDNWAPLDPEQRAELAKLTRDPIDVEAPWVTTVTVPRPEQVPGLDQPPRTGPGSSRDAWAAYADTYQIEYPSGAGRDEIISAVDTAMEARA